MMNYNEQTQLTRPGLVMRAQPPVLRWAKAERQQLNALTFLTYQAQNGKKTKWRK